SFLYTERPYAPLHIGSLGIYEGQIPFDRFVEHIDSRLPNIPRYRQRLAFVPWAIAHPTWEDDPQFDIRRHIHHVTLPEPGGHEELMSITADLFAKPLDRSKPLWEMYIINDLEQDRSGIITKVHHCMVDGVSGIELMMAILDISPEPEPMPETAPWQPKPFPALGTQLADAFWDNLSEQRDRLQEFQEGLIDPQPGLKRAQEMARSLNTTSPWLNQPAPQLPFTGPLGAERRVAFSEVSFVEIREIRTSLGGTVNDVVLAVLAGALRRYLAEHGVDLAGAEPRVAIPVNVRLDDEEGALGNRVSFILAELPVGEADAATRFAKMRERLDHLKEENQAGALEMLSRLAAQIPAPIQALGGILPPANTLVNLICTNVPGPMIPLYSIGHLMLAHYPMVPLSFDMGLGVGVTSYNQRLYFGLMVDPNAVVDLDGLKQCFDESFLELRDAAGVGRSDLPELSAQSSNGASAAVQAASVEQPT
ncbi:MAG: wax ester/triacylglycerol synthase family O-acyltransferase, partial [Chloroflexi bacterium]|nr:wax ester/triacylglycerol synthase family O-acyltransferase [Chloroflexota bacterium]